MSGQRAAARIARRELRRRPVTTLLVALLVAVPVAAMLVALCVVRSLPISEEDLVQRDVGNGQASVVVEAADAQSMGDALRSSSASIEVVPLRFAKGPLASPSGESVWVEVHEAAFDEPMLHDRQRLVEGRLPGAAHEAALTTELADRWGASVGDTLRFDELDREVEVVGIAAVVADARPLLLVSQLPALDPASVQTQFFVDDAAGLQPATLAALRRPGMALQVAFAPGVMPSAAPIGEEWDPDPTSGTIPWVLLGGALSLAVMGIVISSAFAVGARRQLRVLGLLAANGADPSTVRSVVLWQGAWVGVTGAVLGLALGVLVLVAGWPWHAEVLDAEPRWWTWSPVDLVPVVVIAITASVASAAMPARTASRISVLRALAGRRPLAPVRARVVIGGAFVAAAGLGALGVAVGGRRFDPSRANQWTALAIGGGCAVLAGATIAAPALVAVVGRLAGRIHGSGRLALRSVARQRARSGAVVAGVAAAAALCLGSSAAVATAATIDAGRAGSYLPNDVAVVPAWGMLPTPTAGSASGSGPVTPAVTPGVAPGPTARFGPATPAQMRAFDELVPGAVRIDTPLAAAEVTEPRPTRHEFLSAAPASPELLDQLGVPDGAREALGRGEIVALGMDESVSQVELDGYLGAGFSAPGAPPDVVDVTPFPSDGVSTSLPSILIPTDRADELGLLDAAPWDRATFYFAPAPLTPAQRDGFLTVATTRGPGFVLARDATPVEPDLPNVSVRLSSPASFDNTNVALVAIVGATLVFTVFVVVLGLALAARDSRDERDVLEAVGAPPALLRRMAGARAAILAGLGALLAIPTGLLPVWVVSAASQPVLPFTVPWVPLIAIAAAMPVLIGALALAGGSITSRFRPTTASTFATE